MSRRNRNPKSDYLFYLAVWPPMKIVQWAPWWVLRLLARLLGPIIYILGGRHRRRVLLQMRLVFGDRMSEAEIRRMARRSFQHLVMFVFDTLRIDQFGEGDPSRYIDQECIDPMEPVRGRACIMATLHLGGFQQAAQLLTRHGFKMVALQRPLDNPYVDRELQKLRTSHGVETLSKFDSLLTVRRFVRGNYVIALVVDQNGGKKGMFADFLGTPASTWTSAAEMHYMFRIPLIFGSAPRIGLGPKLKVDIFDIIEYDPVKGRLYREDPSARERLTREIVEKMNAFIGQAILDAPEQWLWQHRRWKTRPPGENIPIRDGVPCPWLREAGPGEDTPADLGQKSLPREQAKTETAGRT